MVKVLNYCKILVTVYFFFQIIMGSAQIFAATWSVVWEITLKGKACGVQDVFVENAFNVDFWTFWYDDVLWVVYIKTWAITTWAATPHISNVPGNANPLAYLTVVDTCGIDTWHADLLSSDLVDQNVQNSQTANPIPAYAVAASNENWYLWVPNWWVFFLENTSLNGNVNSYPYPPTPLDSPRQFMRKTSSDWIPGIYGIRPQFYVSIPAYQQPDTYVWTITWTVIIN
jgi:hypothetical protein